MGIGRPSNLIAQREDGNAQLQWSPVVNANRYEVYINCPDTGETTVDRTKTTNFTKTGLKNGLTYFAQVSAMIQDSRSMPSESIEIAPFEQHSSSFEFLAKYYNQSDKIILTWSLVSTTSFYRIERCDNPRRNQFTLIEKIKDNQISTLQDQIRNLCRHDCPGHYYRISLSDNTVVSNRARISNKIFCRTNCGLHQCIVPSKADDGDDSDSQDSLTSTLTTGGSDKEGTVDESGNVIKMKLPKFQPIRKREHVTGNADVTKHNDTSSSSNNTNSNPSVSVCQGDLIAQEVDVIVVCSSSQYLFNAICAAGGDSVKNSFNSKSQNNPDAPIIDVKADGKLRSKRIYFLPWDVDPDDSILRTSIKKFVRNAIRRAVLKTYQSIAFPAIGCGLLGCPASLVAQVMVEEAHFLSEKHGISVLFVIQPEKTNIYDQFQKEINATPQPTIPASSPRTISLPVNKGIIEVRMDDITTQKVDVIIVSASSQYLRDAVIDAGGEQVKSAYNAEYQQNRNGLFLSTPGGALPSKRIFFVRWQPDKDDAKLRQSLVDLVWTVIQNVMGHKFTSLAFPAIGCGKHACSVDIVVKTLVKEMKNQLNMRDLQLRVIFVIETNQQTVYDEFCKQVLATEEDVSGLTNYQIPSIWEKSNDRKLRFELSNTSDEYKTIMINFDQAMKKLYTQIIRIERIQNERWYIQYLAHSQQFLTRFNKDTERRLYHGCPESAVNSILDDCFNRSFAGVNGTLYGIGVYFSSDASYSHGYANPNGENQRHMFVARVLIGNTTIGNGSMRTRPVGYDSTTDGKHIFVTYHDAQAYPEYLIIYK